MAHYIKSVCKKCGNIEMKNTFDILKEMVATGLGIGGIFFWLIATIIIIRPSVGIEIINYMWSIAANNIAGYGINTKFRNIAVQEAMGCRNDYECIVNNLMNYVHENIEYIPDTFGEDIDSPELILERGYGDCTSFAISLTALLRHINIPARVVPEPRHAVVIIETLDGIIIRADPTNNYYEVVS